MRTTITIDDELFARASEIVGDDSASVVVRKALESMVSWEAGKRLAKLGGTMPDFEVATRSGRKPRKK